MVTSTGTFVSCKDYDDDIDRLDQEISNVKDAIKALEDKVGSGKYVESCTPFTDGNGGYEIKFSDGETIKLYNGAKGEQGEPGPMGLPGEKGISEIIIIDKTETVEPDEPAKIQDDFNDNTHHLTFYIPKGEKGEKGDQGSVGPAGPTGSLGPTSYDVIAFVSYPNTTVAGIALTGASRIIPGITNKISMEGSNSIKINQSGLYEITVCGRISGVTKDIGGAFYLIKSETSEVLTDMSFILSKGNTEDMDFSEISFVDITAPATLQIKTEIDGDTATSNIEFSSINVLIKGYSV